MFFFGLGLQMHRAMPAAAVKPTCFSQVQRLPWDCNGMPHASALASTQGNAETGWHREGTLSGANIAVAIFVGGAAVLSGRRLRRALHRMRAADAGLLHGPRNGDAQDVRQLLLSGWTPEIRIPGARQQIGASTATDKCKPPPDLPSELQALQGHWEDLAIGFVVDIDGDKANFHDGTGTWKTEVGSSGLTLRGATLLGGLPDLAAWRIRGNMDMIWQRLDPEIVNEAQLHKRFFHYKWARTMLRRRISSAMAQQDFETAGALLLLWKRGWGFHGETTLEQELRLHAGRFLIPGACVVHRRFGYRAVVLGCEPWVRAPRAHALSAQEREASGTRMYRLQPLYCVLVDDRDMAGGGALFVPEADLEPSQDIFPIHSCHKDRFLEESEAIRAYLPGRVLKQAARRQHLGMPFTLQEA
mmetsp:Transcript_94282/g.181823  ORF Transcript_94282/g.181823 Transcript_94282/m.181823 type:complete len:415 (+) Transcript_94282:82-1326(+)